ncbi:MAG: hypothetical protein KAR87_04435, partial [Candidatus Aenigmarchaeota archaeon]|nr:hypothetical protein [Candidatus Aenigmarchaeota archaeon]
IEFIGENTTYKTIHNKLSFFPPKEQNVQRILFKFEGYDEHNHLRKLGVLKPFTFMTEEDKTKKIKDFVAYFLGLIAIVLFSIPNMMINLKKLYDEK